MRRQNQMHPLPGEDPAVDGHRAVLCPYFQHLDFRTVHEEPWGVVCLVAQELEALPVASGANTERVRNAYVAASAGAVGRCNAG